MYIGLPEYYIYDENSALNAKFSLGGYNSVEYGSRDVNLSKFEKVYSKKYNANDLETAFRISQIVIHLKPKQKKIFETKIDFPYYKGKYFTMKNKNSYFLQIGLNNPVEIIKKYREIISKGVFYNYEIFSGKIISNKIPIVFEVYNNSLSIK